MISSAGAPVPVPGHAVIAAEPGAEGGFQEALNRNVAVPPAPVAAATPMPAAGVPDATMPGGFPMAAKPADCTLPTPFTTPSATVPPQPDTVAALPLAAGFQSEILSKGLAAAHGVSAAPPATGLCAEASPVTAAAQPAGLLETHAASPRAAPPTEPPPVHPPEQPAQPEATKPLSIEAPAVAPRASILPGAPKDPSEDMAEAAATPSAPPSNLAPVLPAPDLPTPLVPSLVPASPPLPPAPAPDGAEKPSSSVAVVLPPRPPSQAHLLPKETASANTSLVVRAEPEVLPIDPSNEALAPVPHPGRTLEGAPAQADMKPTEPRAPPPVVTATPALSLFWGFEPVMLRPMETALPAPAPAPPPARQVLPIAVALAFTPGVANGFQLNLDPVDLGRVEIRVVRKGEAHSVRILAERPETLALLLRDRQELDRGLADAGLRVEAKGIEFALSTSSGQPDQRRQGEARAGTPRRSPQDVPVEPQAQHPPARVLRGLLDLNI